MNKILIIDDEESVRYSFKRFFREPEYKIFEAKNGTEGLDKIMQNAYDLVMLDVRLPDISGLEVLKKIKQIKPRAVVIIMTAYGNTDTAIEATRNGAYDYILKPFDIPSIRLTVDEALKNAHIMQTKIVLSDNPEEQESIDRIIGNSAPMQEVYKLIGRVAGSDVNILIRGESGTGKELVARAIYQYSNRADKPFLAVNCAAIPETLLESELFGYEKGAFTGANQRKIGKFEQVDSGTLFLDEIGDMTPSTQAKILRVLQDGTFERLGGDQTLQTNVRTIAATNRNLERLIDEGIFREDLYYRIKVITITLPPLRLRKTDIPDIANYLLNKHMNLLNKQNLSLSDGTIEEMLKYQWPGNIRELENIIRRAIVLTNSNSISADLLKEEFKTTSLEESKPLGDELRKEITDEVIQQSYGSLYSKIIGEAEKNLILQVLRTTSGNQVKTAKILGISRVMLADRIEKYNLKSKISITED